MRALLDTHVFLWGLAGDIRMSRHARDLFIGPSNLCISIASIWEILIKVQVGKLTLPQPASSYIISKLAENRIEVLPISLDHLLEFERLPMHHRDPFDRILIAQSLKEDLPLVSADPVFERYSSLNLIW